MLRVHAESERTHRLELRDGAARSEPDGTGRDEARLTSPGREAGVDTPSALIADYDAELCAMVARTLRLLGHVSVVVAHGPTALALVDRHAASLQLLVAGVGTPGMSGEQVAQAVAALRPRVPVLLVSAARAPRDLADAVVGRPAAFLVKPFTAEELCRAMNELTS